MKFSDFEDRFLAATLLGDLDYEAQLIAIQHLVRRHRETDNALAEEIRALDSFARGASGLLNEQAVEDWMDKLHSSIFQDAAHSMAAVGMLAPFFESLFKTCFQGIRELVQRNGLPLNAHARWNMAQDKQWDCRCANSGRQNLVQGIAELLEATNLRPHMPCDLRQVLSALFLYRNRMFHLGFEWPLSERRAFAKRITAAGWNPAWFGRSTSGDDPWIFYLSDDYVRHCLDTVEKVLSGLGAYVRKHC